MLIVIFGALLGGGALLTSIRQGSFAVVVATLAGGFAFTSGDGIASWGGSGAKLTGAGGCIVCILATIGDDAACGTTCTELHCGHLACLPAAEAGTLSARPQP